MTLAQQIARAQEQAVAAVHARRARCYPWAISGWWTDGQTHLVGCYGQSPIGLGSALMFDLEERDAEGRPRGEIVREAHASVYDDVVWPWMRATYAPRPVDRVEMRPVVEVRG